MDLTRADSQKATLSLVSGAQVRGTRKGMEPEQQQEEVNQPVELEKVY